MNVQRFYSYGRLDRFLTGRKSDAFTKLTQLDDSMSLFYAQRTAAFGAVSAHIHQYAFYVASVASPDLSLLDVLQQMHDCDEDMLETLREAMRSGYGAVDTEHQALWFLSVCRTQYALVLKRYLEHIDFPFTEYLGPRKHEDTDHSRENLLREHLENASPCRAEGDQASDRKEAVDMFLEYVTDDNHSSVCAALLADFPLKQILEKADGTWNWLIDRQRSLSLNAVTNRQQVA